MHFTKSIALQILSEQALSPRAQRIAEYWLSLWDEDNLPTRHAITPCRIKDLLPGVIFFQVVPRQSVMVRMAGTDFRTLLRRELTGADWLQLTPQHDRTVRLRIFSDVARGAIGLGHWCFARPWHGTISCEKLLLPLRPVPTVPGAPVLGFVDWTALRSSNDREPDLGVITPPRILDRIHFTEGGRIC